MVTDYRAALLKKDRARFAALEGKPPRSGQELWAALGLGVYEPEHLVTRAEVAALVDEVLDPFNLKRWTTAAVSAVRGWHCIAVQWGSKRESHAGSGDGSAPRGSEPRGQCRLASMQRQLRFGDRCGSTLREVLGTSDRGAPRRSGQAAVIGSLESGVQDLRREAPGVQDRVRAPWPVSCCSTPGALVIADRLAHGESPLTGRKTRRTVAFDGVRFVA